MSASTAERLARWERILRAQGYRLTAPRRAVLAVLAASEQVLDAAEIFAQARRQCASLGLVTVYRTLDTLVELGLIERVHRPHGCHGYLPTAEGHQHLLLCRACGRGFYFQGDDMGPLMEAVAAQSGFQVQEHWLQLFGLCAECQSGET